MLGCPGLLNAARAGNVTLANAVGNGVADDKLVYTYMPDLIRYYLDEEPILNNVDTWRLGEAPRRARRCSTGSTSSCSSRCDGSGGKGIVIGPRASRGRARRGAGAGHRRPARLDRPARGAALDRADIRRRRVRPRHVDLRPFAVNDGKRVWVLPGGLTRVALARGRADRELLPRRRVEGHLGARRPTACPGADPAHGLPPTVLERVNPQAPGSRSGRAGRAPAGPAHHGAARAGASSSNSRDAATRAVRRRASAC